MMIQKDRNLSRPQTMSKFQKVQSSPNTTFSFFLRVLTRFFFTYDPVTLPTSLQVQKKSQDLCQIVEAANDSEDSLGYIL
jgi:hypothetical protein